MVEKVKKEKVSLTLDSDVLAWANVLAVKDSRNLSSMVNVLLKGIMEKDEK